MLIRPISAEDVHLMALANLEGEYAAIVTTPALLARAEKGAGTAWRAGPAYSRLFPILPD